MTENSTQSPAGDVSTDAKTESEAIGTTTPNADPAPTSGRKGPLALLLVIAVSLAWYLMADRFTPSTSQARVQAYVVGVGPKVAGKVTAVLVKNNQRVNAGDPLFRVDDSQYVIALRKAQSDLDNAGQQVQAGEAGVTTARANLRAAQANLTKSQKDADRLRRLREEDPGTVSLRRLEISQASLEGAEAQVAAAQSEVQRATEAMGGAGPDNTVLQVAQTGVDKAELDLANTTVIAETDGYITDLRAEVGQFAGTGSPVLTLVAINDLWISADFTENNLGHIGEGTAVEITLDVMPGQIYPGRIRAVGRGVSVGQPARPGTLPSVQNSRDWLRKSQRFPVQVEFERPLPNELRDSILVGGQATVIAYSEEHALLALLGRFYIRLNSYLSYAY